MRRKRGNRRLICSGCGARMAEPSATTEREVRDLPWGEFRTTVVIELYRVRCPKCGFRDDKVIDSRASEDGFAIRRRRECMACNRRFTTYERLEEMEVKVVKKDGVREPYNRRVTIAF